MNAWFAGPKAENGEWFSGVVQRVIEDHYHWRRNYFPEDGVVITSEDRRLGEGFHDDFEDRLMELLAKLKADFPFQSPRYAAHMISEQTLPSIAGYFAAMLYNPNNVSFEAAPVTVKLEIEASQMIARMLGYGDHSWAHLTSGGTIANIEALWVARTVKYLPLVVDEMRVALGLPFEDLRPIDRIRQGPTRSLEEFGRVFDEASRVHGEGPNTVARVIETYRAAASNVVEQGLGTVCAGLGSKPAVLAPESQHYSIKKALDVLGLGRNALVTIKVDSHFRMDMGDLSKQLELLDQADRHVIAVIPIVGTTEEGAIDPVHEILDLRADRESRVLGSFWVHADAAYGGYLRTVTQPDRLGLGDSDTEVKIGSGIQSIQISLPVGATCDALERLGDCDSVTVDPHKLGYVPYPAGVICFKSDIVKPLARQDAPYIEDHAGSVEQERRSESVGVYIIEGSKPGAAAAAVWLSHKLIPLDKSGHGQLIREGIRNAAELHALLEQFPSIKAGQTMQAVPLCPPGSNIVCYAFRSTEKSLSLHEINDLNRTLYEAFSVSLKSGKRMYDQAFFVSRTTVSPTQYSELAVSDFLSRLGVSSEEYQESGVFLLRSVLMNPWYTKEKARGRYFMSEMVTELYAAASRLGNQ